MQPNILELIQMKNKLLRDRFENAKNNLKYLKSCDEKLNNFQHILIAPLPNGIRILNRRAIMDMIYTNAKIVSECASDEENDINRFIDNFEFQTETNSASNMVMSEEEKNAWLKLKKTVSEVKGNMEDLINWYTSQ